MRSIIFPPSPRKFSLLGTVHIHISDTDTPTMSTTNEKVVKDPSAYASHIETDRRGPSEETHHDNAITAKEAGGGKGSGVNIVQNPLKVSDLFSISPPNETRWKLEYLPDRLLPFRLPLLLSSHFSICTLRSLSPPFTSLSNTTMAHNPAIPQGTSRRRCRTICQRKQPRRIRRTLRSGGSGSSSWTRELRGGRCDLTRRTRGVAI